MTSTVSRKTEKEQLFLKLESILYLYKNFQDGAEEEDNLLILEALEDIRQILNQHNITRPLGRTEVKEIESVLKYLKSHVKAMALDDLFDQVKDLKWRMDVIEKRWQLENTLGLPKNYLYDGGERKFVTRKKPAYCYSESDTINGKHLIFLVHCMIIIQLTKKTRTRSTAQYHGIFTSSSSSSSSGNGKNALLFYYGCFYFQFFAVFQQEK